MKGEKYIILTTYCPFIFPSQNASFQIWPCSCFKAVVLRSDLICHMTFLTTASMTISLLKKKVHFCWSYEPVCQYILTNEDQRSKVINGGTKYQFLTHKITISSDIQIVIFAPQHPSGMPWPGLTAKLITNSG